MSNSSYLTTFSVTAAKRESWLRHVLKVSSISLHSISQPLSKPRTALLTGTFVPYLLQCIFQFLESVAVLWRLRRYRDIIIISSSSCFGLWIEFLILFKHHSAVLYPPDVYCIEWHFHLPVNRFDKVTVSWRTCTHCLADIQSPTSCSQFSVSFFTVLNLDFCQSLQTW